MLWEKEKKNLKKEFLYIEKTYKFIYIHTYAFSLKLERLGFRKLLFNFGKTLFCFKFSLLLCGTLVIVIIGGLGENIVQTETTQWKVVCFRQLKFKKKFFFLTRNISLHKI